MKKTQNNEMDLLLRNLAKRRESGSVSPGNDAQNQASLTHLDADELNSFAEGAVPATARARYTAHLVDCSRCRKIVTQLTASAVPPAYATERGRQTETTLWQKVTAFLSPAVLRYAVPALALLAVITVGIVTLRQQNQTDFVATNQRTVSTSPTAEIPTTLDKTEAQARPAAAIRENKPAQDPSTTNANQPAKAGEKSDDAGATTTDSSTVVTVQNTPKPESPSEGQTVFAPEPAPPPPAARPVAKAGSDAKKNEEEAKDKHQADGVVAREVDEMSAAQKEANVSRSRQAAATGRGGAGLRTMEARRGEAAQAKRADEDSETRTVDGRRFRKQGNSWVDTAYDSSRPVMTVVRGSEQYRALVADEPGIHSIAEKLAGEVIVVWKGRAYRIR